jgi:calcium-activated chloride channel regulator 3/4
MKFITKILSMLLLYGFVGGAFAASVYDLRVSYYDSAANTEAKKPQIAATFEHFADAVYEMTNGTHRIGRVSIYSDGAYYDNADVVWRNGSGDGQECWFSAAVNGRGYAGSRIVHCEIGSLPEGSGTITFKTLERPRASGYTLSHEWGHFFYGLFDEYQTSGPCNDDSNPCTTDIGVKNSLMNDPLIAANRVDDSMAYIEWLNFSNSTNNLGEINPTTGKATNAQFRTYGANAWDTLVRAAELDSEFARQSAYGKPRKFYPDLKDGAPVFGQVPSLEIDTPEGRAAARSALQIEWLTGTNTRRSASTSKKPPTTRIILLDNTKQISAGMLEEVKAVVQELIDYAEESDSVAVVALDSPNLLIAPLTTLDSEATRDAVIQAVEKINLGSAAALSPALAATINGAFTSLPTQLTDTTASVYLFAHPSTANTLLHGAAETYRNTHLMLYAFDLEGNNAPNGLVRKFAEQTNGLYATINTPNKLRPALQIAEMESSPSVDALLAMDTLQVSGTQDFAFVVDPTLGEIEANVSYPAASAVTLALLDPQGAVLPFTTEECSDVVRKAYDDKPAENTCFKQLISPASGVWKLRITTTTSNSMTYRVIGYPLDNGKSYFGTVNTHRQNDESLIITAQVGNDLPLTNINVSAKVTKPDGSTAEIIMQDNGIAPDFKALDGVYSGSLANAVDGDYLVAVSFNNHNGSGQFSNSSLKYVSVGGVAVPTNRLTSLTQDFTRVALQQITLLSPYKRMMNWGEAVVAPTLLPERGKQEFDFPPYKGRFYPSTGIYLAYNTQDGNLYLLDQAVGSPQNLGTLANYLSQASSAGF